MEYNQALAAIGWNGPYPGQGEHMGRFYFQDPAGQTLWAEPPESYNPPQAALQHLAASQQQYAASPQQTMVEDNPLAAMSQTTPEGARPAAAIPQQADEPRANARHMDALNDLKGHWIICYGSYAAFGVAVLMMYLNVFNIGRGYAENAQEISELTVAVANAKAVRAAQLEAWGAYAEAFPPVNWTYFNWTALNVTMNMTLNTSGILDYRALFNDTNSTNGTWTQPDLLDPPDPQVCEDQDLGHRLYIFTAIMFMASRLPPLKQVSRDYRVRQLIKREQLPEMAGERALAEANHKSRDDNLLTLAKNLRKVRHDLTASSSDGKDTAALAKEYVDLKEVTKSKFHRQSSRLAAIVAAFAMVYLVLEGSGERLRTRTISNIEGQLEYFNRSKDGAVLHPPEVTPGTDYIITPTGTPENMPTGRQDRYADRYIDRFEMERQPVDVHYVARPQGAVEFLPGPADTIVGGDGNRPRKDLVPVDCPPGMIRVSEKGGFTDPVGLLFDRYTACEDLDTPGSKLVLMAATPLEHCLVTFIDQMEVRQMYVITSFVFMASQCERVVLLLRDWWNEQLCWRSTPYTVICLILSMGLVVHSIDWGMETSRSEVVVAAMACILFLIREAVITVVDSKPPRGDDAKDGLHYTIVRNFYSIGLFLISIGLVADAVLRSPDYWSAEIEPFQPAMMPVAPRNPTPAETEQFLMEVQKHRLDEKILAMNNEETGVVGALSLFMSAFFVVCAAEWMAEVEHDLEEAKRYSGDKNRPYVAGIEALAPATVFHAGCVVMAFVASVLLTFGLLVSSEQLVLHTVVGNVVTLRGLFILSEFFQIIFAFVFAQLALKKGLKKAAPVLVLLCLVTLMGWMPLFQEHEAQGADLTTTRTLLFESTLQLCIAQGFGFSTVSSLFLANEVKRKFFMKPKKKHG
jgi:hypothetical protein